MKILSSDLLSLIKKNCNKMWHDKWTSLENNFTPWYRMISSNIPSQPWFYNLPLSMSQIRSFSRLRSGQNLLPVHSFRLSFNNSPVYPRHEGEVNYDFYHIIRDGDRHITPSIFQLCESMALR